MSGSGGRLPGTRDTRRNVSLPGAPRVGVVHPPERESDGRPRRLRVRVPSVGTTDVHGPLPRGPETAPRPREGQPRGSGVGSRPQTLVEFGLDVVVTRRGHRRLVRDVGGRRPGTEGDVGPTRPGSLLRDLRSPSPSPRQALLGVSRS